MCPGTNQGFRWRRLSVRRPRPTCTTIYSAPYPTAAPDLSDHSVEADRSRPPRLVSLPLKLAFENVVHDPQPGRCHHLHTRSQTEEEAVRSVAVEEVEHQKDQCARDVERRHDKEARCRILLRFCHQYGTFIPL